MFVEEKNRIFVVEDNQVVSSFVKEAYYGSCPHPDCEEFGKTKYDIKKNENCKGCGTSMKVEFPKAKEKKKDSEDTPEDKKESSVVEASKPPWLDEANEDTDDEEDEAEEESDEKEKKTSAGPIDLPQSGPVYDQATQACPGCHLPLGGNIQNPNGLCDGCTKDMMNQQMQSQQGPFQAGARVSYRERPGTIISSVPGIYGETLGVAFDSGEVGEYLASQLSREEGNVPVYLSSVEEISSDFINYESTPANTLDQLESKTRIAKNLNSRARGLIQSAKVSMNERIDLDRIITSTSADIRDFQEGQLHLQEIEAVSYLARTPKYEIDGDFNSWGSVARTKTDEDISWLSDIDVEFEGLSDTRLATLASESIKTLSRNQIENKSFMREVLSYSTGALPKEAHSKFSIFFSEACKMRLEEPVAPIEKEASVQSFDDIDDAALYM